MHVTLVNMPRTERDLDPSGGPLAAFAAELRKLRVEAGSPKYLQMARCTGRSRTALAEAAGGDHLPTWETVEAYIRACGRDPVPWLTRWEQVRDEVRGDRPPNPEAVAATVTEPPVIDVPDKTVPRRTLVLGAATVVTTMGVVMGLRLTSTDASIPPSPGTMRSTGARGPVMLSFSRFDQQHLAVARVTGQVTVLNADVGGPSARSICTRRGPRSWRSTARTASSWRPADPAAWCACGATPKADPYYRCPRPTAVPSHTC